MKTYLTALYFLSIFAGSVSAQNLKGVVIDAGTNQPVPFVNIGVLDKNIGTVSDINGKFNLSLVGEETVRFSSIGYEPFAKVFKEDNLKLTILLIPSTTLLNEVIITGGNFGKEVILGHNIKTRSHSVGFGSRQLGTQIGALLKVRKPTLIDKAHFIINRTSGDSLLYRVNIYDFSKGEPGRNLLSKNVIISAPQEKGTSSVDLSSFDLIIEDDVLLMIEWIQDDKGVGNADIMFRSKKGIESNIYWKTTSFGDFTKLVDLFEGSPTLNMAFYLTGFQQD